MMKERSLSEHVWAFARKHPAFFSTVLVITANAILMFFYSVQLGRFPPLFYLNFTDAVIILVGTAIVGLALALFAGSYVIVPLVIGPPPDREQLSDRRHHFIVWFFLISCIEVATLVVAYLWPFEYVLWPVVALLMVGGVWCVGRFISKEPWLIFVKRSGNEDGAFIPDQVSHFLFVVMVGLFFLFWNLLLVALRDDTKVFFVFALMTVFASTLLAIMVGALHDKRLPSSADGRSEERGGILPAVIGVISMVLFGILYLYTAFGSGPWPLLHVGRYDAVCIVEKEGVDALVSEYEALGARRSGGGKDGQSDGKDAVEGFGRELAAKVWGCEQKSSGPYSCRFHVWWGVGDEWLVSEAGAPQWTFESPRNGFRILSLASRYVRGCVPITPRNPPDCGKDGECGSLAARRSQIR